MCNTSINQPLIVSLFASPPTSLNFNKNINFISRHNSSCVRIFQIELCPATLGHGPLPSSFGSFRLFLPLFPTAAAAVAAGHRRSPPRIEARERERDGNRQVEIDSERESEREKVSLSIICSCVLAGEAKFALPRTCEFTSKNDETPEWEADDPITPSVAVC